MHQRPKGVGETCRDRTVDAPTLTCPCVQLLWRPSCPAVLAIARCLPEQHL